MNFEELAARYDLQPYELADRLGIDLRADDAPADDLEVIARYAFWKDKSFA